ncbi:PREDICTED: uncharacterized protein LOC109187268 [Ipomoea nil]|uniref:uncharacterized protein LOC109187268 n=1 Tax=Ipomoea nil TaxID=35883 RepID=UPI000900F521|nr:PREDICTED: uncharacterized protein LOC109187268 [Ipomoea nil]
MSTTIITDSVVVNAATVAAAAPPLEAEFVKCDCCGLSEECTQEYIETIRERYQGKWICGLCAEAVKDEIVRSERLISAEEALARHLNFCKKFRCTTPPPNPAVHLIATMKQILRRSSESRKVASLPCSPTKNAVSINRRAVLTRTESCIPNLPPVDHSTDKEPDS